MGGDAADSVGNNGDEEDDSTAIMGISINITITVMHIIMCTTSLSVEVDIPILCMLLKSI